MFQRSQAIGIVFVRVYAFVLWVIFIYTFIQLCLCQIYTFYTRDQKNCIFFNSFEDDYFRQVKSYTSDVYLKDHLNFSDALIFLPS